MTSQLSFILVIINWLLIFAVNAFDQRSVGPCTPLENQQSFFLASVAIDIIRLSLFAKLVRYAVRLKAQSNTGEQDDGLDSAPDNSTTGLPVADVVPALYEHDGLPVAPLSRPNPTRETNNAGQNTFTATAF